MAADAVPAIPESKIRSRVAPLLTGTPMKREREAGTDGTFYTPLRATKKGKTFSPAPSTGSIKPIEEAFESWLRTVHSCKFISFIY